MEISTRKIKTGTICRIVGAISGPGQPPSQEKPGVQIPGPRPAPPSRRQGRRNPRPAPLNRRRDHPNLRRGHRNLKHGHRIRRQGPALLPDIPGQPRYPMWITIGTGAVVVQGVIIPGQPAGRLQDRQRDLHPAEDKIIKGAIAVAPFYMIASEDQA